MNPDNNNPTAPGADAPNTGLSMADGLASAQDNLTSAGMAADNGSSVMGLDAISAAAPEAVMTPPVEEPLIPAAPVPGSIGSVTSVPPLDDPSAAVPPTPPADMTGTAPADVTAPATEPAMTSSEQTAPYNPFLQSAMDNQTSSAPVAESTAMPAAPVTKSKVNLVTIIALVMDAILLITTIVFAVLFVNANNKKPETIYVPAGTGATVEKETLTCTRETDFARYAGLEVPAMGEQVLTVSYADGELSNLKLDYNMHFADEVTADTALNNFNAEQNELLTAIESSFGVDSSINGGDLDIAIVAGNDNLTDANAALLMYGLGNEQASVASNAVRALYEGAGFTCNIAK